MVATFLLTGTGNKMYGLLSLIAMGFLMGASGLFFSNKEKQYRLLKEERKKKRLKHIQQQEDLDRLFEAGLSDKEIAKRLNMKESMVTLFRWYFEER
jgi:DNA-binding NarL/FixJ family response regulator